MRRTLAGALGVLLGLAAVVLGAPAAQAHNVLQSTDPAEGSTVQVVPEQVTLTFNEPVLMVGTEIMVHTADETMVNIGPPILVDNTAGIAVTGELPAGEYTVIYRVTSADGHPIEGQFRFTAAEATSYGVATVAPTMTPSPTTSAEVQANESAAPSPSPSASSAPAAAEERVSGAVLVGAVAAFVVIGGVVAWLLLRRRPAGGPTDLTADPPSGGV